MTWVEFFQLAPELDPEARGKALAALVQTPRPNRVVLRYADCQHRGCREGCIVQRLDDEVAVIKSAYVLVRNSTPEPDGSFKPYALRVDPNYASNTCQAIAWTFGRQMHGWYPQAET